MKKYCPNHEAEVEVNESVCTNSDANGLHTHCAEMLDGKFCSDIIPLKEDEAALMPKEGDK